MFLVHRVSKLITCVKIGAYKFYKNFLSFYYTDNCIMSKLSLDNNVYVRQSTTEAQ